MTTVQLIREQPGNSIFSRRQWWSINDNLTATVAYSEKICCVWVETLQGKNISQEMANRIYKTFSKNYKTSATIDSWYIEVPKDDIEELLSKIGMCGRELG